MPFACFLCSQPSALSPLFTMAARVPPAEIADCESFLDWFAHPSNDHFDGAGIMTVTTVRTWQANTVTNTITNMVDGVPLAFVGLFPDAAHAGTGTTRLLMFPKTYPTTLRGATPYDGNVYAFVDEVGGGAAPTIQFPTNPFALATDDATVVPVDPTAFVTTMSGHANALNARLTAAAGTTQEVRCSRLTWVPPRYVPHLIGRRLTPRQAALDILPIIMTDGTHAQATPFVN